MISIAMNLWDRKEFNLFYSAFYDRAQYRTLKQRVNSVHIYLDEVAYVFLHAVLSKRQMIYTLMFRINDKGCRYAC